MKTAILLFCGLTLTLPALSLADDAWTFEKIKSEFQDGISPGKEAETFEVLLNINKYRNETIATDQACKKKSKSGGIECTFRRHEIFRQQEDFDKFYPTESKFQKAKSKSFFKAGQDRISFILDKIKSNRKTYSAFKLQALNKLEDEVCTAIKRYDFRLLGDNTSLYRKLGLPISEELEMALQTSPEIPTPDQIAALSQIYFCDQQRALSFDQSRQTTSLACDAKNSKGNEICEQATDLNQTVSNLSRVKPTTLKSALGQKNLGSTCFANASHVLLDTLSDIYPDLLDPRSAQEIGKQSLDAHKNKTSPNLPFRQAEANKAAIRLLRRFKVNTAKLNSLTPEAISANRGALSSNHMNAELENLFDSHDEVLRERNLEKDPTGNDTSFTSDEKNWRGQTIKTYLRKHRQDPTEYLNNLVLENMDFANRHGIRIINTRHFSDLEVRSVNPPQTGLMVGYLYNPLTGKPSDQQDLQKIVNQEFAVEPAFNYKYSIKQPEKGTSRKVLMSQDGTEQSLMINLKRTDHRKVNVAMNLDVSMIDSKELPKNMLGKVTEGTLSIFSIKQETMGLRSVIIHKQYIPGFRNFSHYYTYTFDPKAKKWMRRDDNKRVSFVSTEEAMDDIEHNGTVFLYAKPTSEKK